MEDDYLILVFADRNSLAEELHIKATTQRLFFDEYLMMNYVNTHRDPEKPGGKFVVYKLESPVLNYS